MSETKHTTGALKAAAALDAEGFVFAWKQNQAAEIIDRETNLVQLEADSKKLREPAICNAGHKSNLPVALWDCPVCTQLLRDQLSKLLEAANPFVFDRPRHSKSEFAKLEEAIREVEAALGGKAE